MNTSEYNIENRFEFLRKTDDELLKLSRVDVFKATGKGGQKKNKTSNAIRLSMCHLSVTESKSRSKAENIKGAVKKLRLAIALDKKDATSSRVSVYQTPSEIKPYLNTGEIKISVKNPLYPIFIGILFNCYIKNGGNWSDMGKNLGFTSSQIRKFVDKNAQLKRKFSEVRTTWENTTTPV